jgi:RimJ/RimL family protein N-acetyltransferase
VRLQRVPDRAARDALLAGDLGDLDAAPGWPHDDTAAGLSFLDAGGIAFLVVDDADRVIGECGTKGPPDHRGSVEIGYGLAAPSRGQGLGTAAVRALIAALGSDPAVRTVTAEVQVSNVASRRILERLGFAAYDGPTNGYVRYRLGLGDSVPERIGDLGR